MGSCLKIEIQLLSKLDSLLKFLDCFFCFSCLRYIRLYVHQNVKLEKNIFLPYLCFLVFSLIPNSFVVICSLCWPAVQLSMNASFSCAFPRALQVIVLFHFNLILFLKLNYIWWRSSQETQCKHNQTSVFSEKVRRQVTDTTYSKDQYS